MPPAGRAPPCTRWGASRPPDPGVTPVNENGSASGLRRLRNRFRLRASCRRRTIPRFSFRKRSGRSSINLYGQSPRSFAFGTQNERLSPSGKIKTFPEGVTGKLTPRLEPPKRRSRHPSHVGKSLKRKGGGLEGGGRKFLPPPSNLTRSQTHSPHAWRRGCRLRRRDERPQRRREAACEKLPALRA